MPNNALSLYELNQQLKKGLEGLFPFPVWIMAEISEMNSTQHCYLELIERSEATDKTIAKMRATIWSYTYNIIKPYFETTTGYALSAGLKVLLCVEVQFSERYGLSLNVKDIDPNYTLGDMQQRKRAILQRLEEEGILEMNKMTIFPSLPKTLAVISSQKAAGFQDFEKQLHQNTYGYQFHTKLFPALMQGEQASAAIVQALEQIYDCEELFDAVVIIRGGGAVAELSCFDDYDLAAHIAQFPLPVLTGIGHEKDKSVVDEVAYYSFKTPTAVASFLLDCFQDFEHKVIQASETFSNLIKTSLDAQYQKFGLYSQSLKYSLHAYFQTEKQELKLLGRGLEYTISDKLAIAKNKQRELRQNLYSCIEKRQYYAFDKLLSLEKNLVNSTEHFLQQKSQLLTHKEQLSMLLSPQKLLERGYSITTYQGKVVKDAAALSQGDELTTHFARGEQKSIVK